jgi:hypothetical protein
MGTVTAVTTRGAAGPRFARNVTSKPGSAHSKPVVNALISTIFAQTSQEAVTAQCKHVISSLRDTLRRESSGRGDPFPRSSPSLLAE